MKGKTCVLFQKAKARVLRSSLTYDKSAASTMKRYWQVTKKEIEDDSSNDFGKLDTPKVSEKKNGAQAGKLKLGEPQGRAVNRQKYLLKKMPHLTKETDTSE